MYVATGGIIAPPRDLADRKDWKCIGLLCKLDPCPTARRRAPSTPPWHWRSSVGRPGQPLPSRAGGTAAGHGGVQVDGAPEPWRLELAGRPLDAGARWQELGCPYDAALSFAHADDTAALRLAHGVLQELGAAPAAAIVARRLRGRGVTGLPRGPRPSTRAKVP